MSKVYLFVAIDVKPGKTSIFLEKIAKHGSHIRTEEGCEALEIFTDTNNPNQVCVWEVWTNRQIWDAHMINDASAALIFACVPVKLTLVNPVQLE